MPAEHPDLLTKAEAAEKLRVSPSTLDRLRAHGEIAWVPVGRQVRFRPEALAEYVERVERRVCLERARPRQACYQGVCGCGEDTHSGTRFLPRSEPMFKSGRDRSILAAGASFHSSARARRSSDPA